MAQGKKSFIAYADWLETFEECTDEEAGKLVKHVFRYVNDQNPEPPDRLTKMLFLDIKRSLKRDLKKFEQIKKKRSEAGKASAEKRKQKSTNPTSVKSVEQSSTNPTVNVNDTVNDSVSDNEFFDNEELNKAFADFQDHRKQLKKKMTSKAIDLMVKKLKKVTPAVAVKMIEQSIENGWSGVFELKHEKTEKGTVKNFDNVEYP